LSTYFDRARATGNRPRRRFLPSDAAVSPLAGVAPPSTPAGSSGDQDRHRRAVWLQRPAINLSRCGLRHACEGQNCNETHIDTHRFSSSRSCVQDAPWANARCGSCQRRSKNSSGRSRVRGRKKTQRLLAEPYLRPRQFGVFSSRPTRRDFQLASSPFLTSKTPFLLGVSNRPLGRNKVKGSDVAVT
jgi:hypothetical protein